eukprot:Em0014g424a
MQPVSTQPSPQRINPERAARVHKDSIVAAETPCKEDSSQVSSSQAHILNAEADGLIKSLTRHLIAGQATDEIEIDDKDHVPSVATSIDIASLLRINKSYARHLTHGTKLQEFNQTLCMWESGVEKLEYVFTMRSLVLKHDIATMYKVYSEKYKDAMPGKPPIGRMLFYLIAKTSPEMWTTSCIDELCGLHSDVYTFLSYGLRRVCIAIVDEDPIRLAEVADILLTIHQWQSEGSWQVQWLREALGTGTGSTERFDPWVNDGEKLCSTVVNREDFEVLPGDGTNYPTDPFSVT